MKYLNDLYRILSKEIVDTTIRYDIQLDVNHIIYQAHFPGEPITPGVCIIQIAKELLEDYLGQKLCIQSIKNVKFLNVISPIEMSKITYVLDKIVTDDVLKATKVMIQICSDGVPLAKLSFTCKHQ